MSKITNKQVEEWLGSDVDIEECIAIITEIAQGTYRVDQLRTDIESYG